MTSRRPLPPPRKRPEGAPLALAGLRIVDFTRILAGPVATQMLADFGAEVIKIESFAGDDSRVYLPPDLAGEGAFYLSANRNKRSIALDLKHPEGCRIARELIGKADILVENFSNGVMERFGLGYEQLAAGHPRLIYCSLSGYGRDDDAATPRTGFDAMFQAGSGFMSLTGEPDGAPMRTTVPVIDISSAMLAANAVLAAVVARERLGIGQHIDVPLFDVAISALGYFGLMFLISGDSPGRLGNRAALSTPSDVYQASDGPIFLTSGNDRLFRRLVVEGLGRPDLIENPDFATNGARCRNHVEITAILSGIFREHTRDHWVERLGALGVPIAPVRTVGEALDTEEVLSRGLIADLDHPTAGSVPTLCSPLRMSVTPVADPVAPPLLGQHTRTVLADVLGYSEAAIAAAMMGGGVK